MTADMFPAGLALAALGGASEDWQQGYRLGWEDAREEANFLPSSWRERRAERRRRLQLRRQQGVYLIPKAWSLFPDMREGYYAGRAAYERENR